MRRCGGRPRLLTRSRTLGYRRYFCRRCRSVPADRLRRRPIRRRRDTARRAAMPRPVRPRVWSRPPEALRTAPVGALERIGGPPGRDRPAAHVRDDVGQLRSDEIGRRHPTHRRAVQCIGRDCRPIYFGDRIGGFDDAIGNLTQFAKIHFGVSISPHRPMLADSRATPLTLSTGRRRVWSRPVDTVARHVKPDEYAAHRRQILAAARKLMHDKGYEHMTVQDLLDELQISMGALYHYFASKEGLVEGVV